MYTEVIFIWVPMNLLKYLNIWLWCLTLEEAIKNSCENKTNKHQTKKMTVNGRELRIRLKGNCILRTLWNRVKCSASLTLSCLSQLCSYGLCLRLYICLVLHINIPTTRGTLLMAWVLQKQSLSFPFSDIREACTLYFSKMDLRDHQGLYLLGWHLFNPENFPYSKLWCFKAMGTWT